MIDYVFKYGTGNLIIIYCCVYSKSLGIIENIIWNSMELMRVTESSSQIDK